MQVSRNNSTSLKNETVQVQLQPKIFLFIAMMKGTMHLSHNCISTMHGSVLQVSQDIYSTKVLIKSEDMKIT